MAWFNIEHSCGHVERVRIYDADRREAEDKAEWMATRPCMDCVREERDAAARATDAKLDMAPLTGSEKQVAWAETIRSRTMAQAQAKLRAAERKGRTGAADGWRDVVDAISSQASAAWWIEHRYEGLRALSGKEL